MAELILTDDEKGAPLYSEWADDTLGKAVRELLYGFADVAKDQYQGIVAVAALHALTIASERAGDSSCHYEYTLREGSAWRVTVEKVDEARLARRNPLPIELPMADQILATAWATAAHHGVTRKSSDEPYICHPLAVHKTLVEEGVTCPHTLTAALLHDVVEDTHITLDQIQETFGDRVALYVGMLTNDSGLPHKEKKARMVERLRGATLPVKAIKLADRIDNLGDPPPTWTDVKWGSYLDESDRLLEAIAEAPPGDSPLGEVVRSLQKKLRAQIALCRELLAAQLRPRREKRGIL